VIHQQIFEDPAKLNYLIVSILNRCWENSLEMCGAMKKQGLKTTHILLHIINTSPSPRFYSANFFRDVVKKYL